MKQINKFLSMMLVFVIFVSLFSFSSFADSSITYRLYDFQLVSDTDEPDIFSLITLNGKTYTKVAFNGSVAKVSAFYKLSDQLKAGNSYTLTFNVINGVSSLGNVYCEIALSDSPTNYDNAVTLGYFDSSDIANSASSDFSIQVTYPDAFNGKQCYMLVAMVKTGNSSTFYMSDFVFTNNNQTEEKIDSILDLLSAVYHGIVGGEDSRGVQHDGLVQGIKNGLSALGDRIVNAFENIKISIENKIEAIGDWFNELGEKISDGFDYIVDMILYFEHPVEKNADGVPINTNTGQPVYTNPFKSVWEDIESKLNEWIVKISDFIDSMESARDNVTSYMDTGKQLIDGVITGVPILGALFIFVAGFYVIRKVVGQ